MVSSQQSNHKLSLDYDHGDLECFFARDTASCQEKSLAAPFSASKPHEDLPYSPTHGIESRNNIKPSSISIKCQQCPSICFICEFTL